MITQTLAIHKALLRKLSIYGTLYVLTLGLIISVFTLSPDTGNDFPLLRTTIIVFASILLTKYFVYMLVGPWYDVVCAYNRYKEARSVASGMPSPYRPKVSVLVPAWNEEVGVLTTAQTLLGGTYKNLEIIIIDNASTDGTEKKVRAFIREHRKNARKEPNIEHPSILYTREDSRGKGHALNRGIRKASGDIIVSIDADCSVESHAIENFVKHFRDPKVMAAVGNVKIGNTMTILGVIQHLEFLFSFYFKKADSILNSIYIIGGAAGAFRKDVFKKIGPYNPNNITEDIELSVRIQDAGMKIVYAADALVYTEGASDLHGLMKQRLRWKRGRFETFATHRHLFFSTKKHHNKVLSWIILPLALFGEVQLSLELLFIAFLYVVAYFTGDYSSFISGIIVVGSMFVVQVAFDKHRESRLKFILLAPIGWLLFYVSTFVEASALFRSLHGHIRGTAIEWQQWKRQGVFSN